MYLCIMKQNITDFSNIQLSREDSNIYGNTDGLSLQNIFYTENGFFPAMWCFSYESRTNGDYTFDVQKILDYLLDTFDSDDLMIIPYWTEILGKKEEPKTDLGLCARIKSLNLCVRFDESPMDSYILFDIKRYNEMIEFKNSILKFYFLPKSEECNYWKLCQNSNGYYLDKGKIKPPKDFDIAKLYNDSFIEEDKKIKEFINKKEKSGLIILHGERGTGKSTYIKHLVGEFTDKKFVYVSSSLIRLFSQPAFQSFLTTLNNHIIILEDCENAIRDRKSGQSDDDAVSLLLNLTDGILGDDLEMKFICTFNDDMKNIDPALLRKGRLVSKYEFKGLEKEKAQSLLKELGHEVMLEKNITLADIFNWGDEDYDVKKKSII